MLCAAWASKYRYKGCDAVCTRQGRATADHPTRQRQNKTTLGWSPGRRPAPAASRARHGRRGVNGDGLRPGAKRKGFSRGGWDRLLRPCQALQRRQAQQQQHRHAASPCQPLSHAAQRCGCCPAHPGLEAPDQHALDHQQQHQGPGKARRALRVPGRMRQEAGPCKGEWGKARSNRCKPKRPAAAALGPGTAPPLAAPPHRSYLSPNASRSMRSSAGITCGGHARGAGGAG